MDRARILSKLDEMGRYLGKLSGKSLMPPMVEKLKEMQRLRMFWCIDMIMWMISGCIMSFVTGLVTCMNLNRKFL